MNNVKEAKEHFEAAIRIKPNHLEVLRTLLLGQVAMCLNSLRAGWG